MPIIRASIIGTKYRGGAAIKALAGLKKGSTVELRAEPENQHDANAVAAYSNGEHIGYIPRGENQATAVAMRAGQAPAGAVIVEAIVDRGNVVAAPKIEWEIADAE